jgi:hypothetical protein
VNDGSTQQVQPGEARCCRQPAPELGRTWQALQAPAGAVPCRTSGDDYNEASLLHCGNCCGNHAASSTFRCNQQSIAAVTRFGREPYRRGASALRAMTTCNNQCKQCANYGVGQRPECHHYHQRHNNNNARISTDSSERRASPFAPLATTVDDIHQAPVHPDVGGDLLTSLEVR